MGFLENIRDTATKYVSSGGFISPYLPQINLIGGGRVAGNLRSQNGQGTDPNGGKYPGMIAAINNANISPTIKKNLLSSSLGPDALEAEFNRAKAGEGRYGVLNASYQSQLLFVNRPGTAQLFASGVSRSAAQTGLLTTNASTSLLAPKTGTAI